MKTRSLINSSIVKSRNPELIFTLPDLLDISKDCILRNVISDHIQKNEDWNKIFSSPKKMIDYCVKTTSARNSFRILINRFLLHKHCCDHFNNDNYTYLEKGLNQLRYGDYIISTNWDTLAERALMNKKKWYPWDGYGFDIPIKIYHPYKQRRLKKNNPNEIFKKRSQVKVLKLHGSIGWHAKKQNDQKKSVTYLQYSSYLQYLTPPDLKTLNLKICDTNSPKYGSDDNHIMIFPSYIKSLENPTLQSIWHQADEALSKADEVVFIGYSLPSADVGIRALLNQLRFRIENKAVKVTVVIREHRRTSEAAKNWKNFLGNKIAIKSTTAKKYFIKSL